MNPLAAVEAAAEQWPVVFMMLVPYLQLSLSWQERLARLALRERHTLVVLAEHHLLQAADLPCKRLVAAVGVVQMDMIAVAVEAEEQLAQVPEEQVH